MEDAQQHFQERLLAEMKKTSSIAATATTPFNLDERDMISIIQEGVQSFYNDLDENDANRIKDNLRKLTTEMSENKDLANIIQERLLKFESKEDPADPESNALAGDTVVRIQDAAHKLNAMLLTTEQTEPESMMKTNKDMTMMRAIMRDLDEALDQATTAGEDDDVDALLFAMMEGWKSSMETFHEALKEHQLMDKASEEGFGQLLVSLRNNGAGDNVNLLQDPCNGDPGCQALVWVILIPVIIILLLLSPILLILFIVTLPITLPIAFILLIAYLIDNAQVLDVTPATSCDGCDGQ